MLFRHTPPKKALPENDLTDLSVFDRSLAELTPEDLGPAPFPQKPGDRLYNLVRLAVVVLCLAVFGYCVFLLISHMDQYQKTDTIYGDLANQFFDVTTDENVTVNDHVTHLAEKTPSVAIPVFDQMLLLSDNELKDYYREETVSYNLDFERMRSKLEDLKTINEDIVGYLYIPGTKISYPVTQYTDNDYYLSHSFDRSHLISGTIFMDFTNQTSLSENRNLVLYGHNMKNGSMFGQVSKFYQNEAMFDDTPIILYAFDGIYTFEIFSVYRTTSDYPYFHTQFDTDEAFLTFAETVRNNSVYARDVSFTADDLILTLSTCTNLNKNGRYALHAKLISLDH